MNTILAKKLHMTSRFDAKGNRVSVTLVSAQPNTITQVRTQEKDGYWAVQLGMGTKKHTNKPLMGHFKKANLESAPRFIKETRITDKDVSQIELGSQIKVTEVIKPGDLLLVSGVSKGKGFQGGMKRWGFHGGPASHGQSDRSRAPGSIGSGTTPGRVYKGKKMAGKMGNDNVTVKNLEVFDVNEKENTVEVMGSIPGHSNGFLVLQVIGENKKHIGPAKAEIEDASAGASTELSRTSLAQGPKVEEQLEASVEEGAVEVFEAETGEETAEPSRTKAQNQAEEEQATVSGEEAEDKKAK